MKFAFIIFGVIVVLLAVLMFGSIGLAKLCQWLRLPPDILALAGLVMFLLSGMLLAAWRWSELDARQAEREEQQEVQ